MSEQAQDEASPLQWGAASIVWTREGHVLAVPMWLDDRATLLFEDAISPAPLEADWTFEPAVWSKSKAGTDVKHGWLMIRSRTLLVDLNPLPFRKEMDNAARAARTQAKLEQQSDEGDIAAIMEVLRG